MSAVLIELRGLCRSFPAGDEDILILDDINLSIARGEMVAIIGQSGSGKSTLMNILGGLDSPSSGSYRFAGREVGELAADELAALRRDHFGFIFQRYHLLGALSATENVAVPAVYAGLPQSERKARAAQLLTRLGLAERLEYKPRQLSGGQQQRVSIARALMNGGEVILADEPTGALDSKSGEDVLQILRELHEHGHTVILVTHDSKVAAQADRIIEIRDGRILSDMANPVADPVRLAPDAPPPACHASAPQALLGQWREAFAMALRALLANRMRSLLTMLGIIIGIASVVSIMALGEGMERKVLDNFAGLGVNNISVYPGAYPGDDKAASIKTLNENDLQQLAREPYLDGVTPFSQRGARLRAGSVDVNATVQGVAPDYFRIRNQGIKEGVAFSAEDVRRQAQVAVIGEKTRERLFGQMGGVGQIILVGNIPVQVIGVAEAKSSGFGFGDSLDIWLPYSTAGSRLFGQLHFSSLTVQVRDGLPVKAAEAALQKRLESLHGRRDFFTHTMEDMMKNFESTASSIKLFLLMIGVISLVVGGIGVMNIMLVSVTERTHEIGIRMAVGARQSDIRSQFLIEAVVVCLLGAGIGIGLSALLGAAVNAIFQDFQMLLTTGAIGTAVLCASGIGIVFGFLPARRAAQLAPIEALVRE
ncbi:MacB family efflux pump subunit [Chitinilyticum piscinae]|uniref:MacB family efflux pump subunit n=1 Tax=Chitinilyticum piscinae TaxID=2866724 RepID=A0A8J7K1G2_9NEIS|nr:MacB family efflux pump subunit [Chitinilyticum piscinae]MBE9608647.1 MacB family efflux pump subunit [Chitinilyticum piscinae]